MLQTLNEVISDLPNLILNAFQEGTVRTMYIDYEKPIVYRIWFPYKDGRIYLHRINKLETNEKAFLHFHEWESAMAIYHGKYEMGIGISDTDDEPKINTKFILSPESKYEMVDPTAWHYVKPLKDTYTLMVTGKLNGRKQKDKPEEPFRELTKDEILDMLWYFLDEPEIESQPNPLWPLPKILLHQIRQTQFIQKLN